MSKTTYRQIREKTIRRQNMASSSGLNITLLKGGFMMEGEKREERKDIIVLDEGIASGIIDGPGPESACCWFCFSPLRG
jgi:hypothetical protein